MRYIIGTLAFILGIGYIYSQTYKQVINPRTGKFDIVGYNVDYDTTNFRVAYTTNVSAPNFIGNVTGTASGSLPASSGTVMSNLFKTLPSTYVATIVAGSNISITPADGKGVVTITAAAGTSADDVARSSLSVIGIYMTDNNVSTNSLDMGKLPISSGTTIAVLSAAKLDASSGTTIADLSASKLNASSGTLIGQFMTDCNISTNALAAISYSTGGIVAIFGSTNTSAGNLIGLNTFMRVPYSCTIKCSYIASDVSGNALVVISTGQSNAGYVSIVGTDEPELASSLYTADTTLTWTTLTLDEGAWIKFEVTQCATLKQLTCQIDVWGVR